MPVENTRDDILRKVQALLAKANSTTFEAEADSFRQAANNLMDKFRIEQWEIAKREAGMSKVIKMNPVRKDVPITWWWYDEHNSALYQIFVECSKLCAVIISPTKADGRNQTIPCYGLDSDIAFMQMLFTDLHVQMSNKIRPKFDPDKSIGYNVYQAKESGMKYKDIAIWCGHPEWIDHSKKQPINGIMIREMKKYAAANHLEVHKEVSLGSYIADFISSYAYAVRQKMHEMRTGEVRNTGGMDIVIRSIEDEAREYMYMDFPDLRPHPVDCQCDDCHFRKCCDNTCTRTRCVEARKPTKYRSSNVRYRNTSVAGTARGAQAGSEARILSKTEAVEGRPRPKPDQLK
jgi:hypothetical protein